MVGSGVFKRGNTQKMAENYLLGVKLEPLAQNTGKDYSMRNETPEETKWFTFPFTRLIPIEKSA